MTLRFWPLKLAWMVLPMRKLLMAMLTLLCVLTPVIARADCTQGEHVLLLSNTYDPDVLIWDSRQRLLDYAAGNWDIKRILLPHALLARAGTRAVVIACRYNIVHPKYRLAPADAAGVLVLSGPYKGRYGWLLADDLRRIRASR